MWDPLPQIAPLLPAERPEEAPPREVAANDAQAAQQPRAGRSAGRATPADEDDGEAEAGSRAAARGQSRRQQKSAGKTGAFDVRAIGRGGYCVAVPPPPCSAILELYGESPCLGSSTTTMVPCLTRL